MPASVLYVLGASVLGAGGLFLAGMWGYGMADSPDSRATAVAFVLAVLALLAAGLLLGVA